MKKALLLLMMVCASFILNAQSKQETLLKEGIDLHDNGKYREAIAKYKEALRIDSTYVEAWAEMIMSYYRTEDYLEAIRLSKETIKKFPDSEFLNNVYVAYGNSLDAAGRSGESMTVYKEGVKKFPESYMLFFNLGVAEYGEKKYEEAKLSLQRAITLKPNHASSHFVLAIVLDNLSLRIPSIMAMTRFLDLEPEGKRATTILPFVYKRLSSGVEKTGKNSITISIDAATLDTTKKEDNFGSVEMLVSMSSALDYDGKNKKKNQVELLAQKLETMFSMLKDNEKNQGFYWKYYAPYFAEMKEKGLIETYAYIINASNTEDKYIAKWLEKNKKKVQEFYEWSDSFKWSKRV